MPTIVLQITLLQYSLLISNIYNDLGQNFSNSWVISEHVHSSIGWYSYVHIYWESCVHVVASLWNGH